MVTEFVEIRETVALMQLDLIFVNDAVSLDILISKLGKCSLNSNSRKIDTDIELTGKLLSSSLLY